MACFLSIDNSIIRLLSSRVTHCLYQYDLFMRCNPNPLTKAPADTPRETTSSNTENVASAPNAPCVLASARIAFAAGALIELLIEASLVGVVAAKQDASNVVSVKSVAPQTHAGAPMIM
jgi:hypothetical protein